MSQTSIDHDQNMNIFEEKILRRLSFWPQMSATLAKEGLEARPLRVDDYDKGYTKLLEQLTYVGDVSKSEFERRFNQMQECNKVTQQYIIVVIEDKTSKSIVAASTLFFELKFIHSCGLRGRLEEVCVIDIWRGKSLGKHIVKIIVGLAMEVYGCYKLTLDCTDDLVDFYKKNDFKQTALQMTVRSESN